MYSARDNEGHLKVCLTLIFKVNYGGQATYVNHNNNNKYIYNAHNYCQQHHRGAVGGQQLAVNK